MSKKSRYTWENHCFGNSCKDRWFLDTLCFFCLCTYWIERAIHLFTAMQWQCSFLHTWDYFYFLFLVIIITLSYFNSLSSTRVRAIFILHCIYLHSCLWKKQCDNCHRSVGLMVNHKIVVTGQVQDFWFDFEGL